MSGDLQIRVMVLDAWDGVPISLPATTPVSEVKRLALEAARVTEDPAEFLVKFRGAELRDESRTLGDEAVPSDGALIVMRRRRIPVR